MFAFDYDSTAADFAAFRRAAQSRALGTNWPMWLVAFTAAFGVSYGSTTGLLDRRTTFVLVIALAAFWMFFRYRIRSVVRPDPRGSLIGRFTMEVDDRGVSMKTAQHTAHTKWPGVLAVEETDTHVLLFTDRLAGYYIPKRAFADAAQVTAFLAFVRAQMDAAMIAVQRSSR